LIIYGYIYDYQASLRLACEVLQKFKVWGIIAEMLLEINIYSTYRPVLMLGSRLTEGAGANPVCKVAARSCDRNYFVTNDPHIGDLSNRPLAISA